MKQARGSATTQRLELVTTAGARPGAPSSVPQFLTLPEVAALLRLSRRTVYQMVHQRRIPFRKAGRQLLFEAREIDQWTKEGARK